MSEKKQNKNDFGFGIKPGNKDSKGTDKKPKFNITWIYGMIAIFIIGMMFFPMGSQPVEIMMGRFKNKMLKTHSVEKIIVVNGNRAEVYIKADKLSDPEFSDIKTSKPNAFGVISAHYFMKIGSIEVFTAQLTSAMDEYGFSSSEYVEVGYDTRENHMDWIISWVIFPLLLIGVWLFIFRRMGGANGPGGQIFNIGK